MRPANPSMSEVAFAVAEVRPLLRRMELLAELDDAELDELAGAMTMVALPAGAHVFREGELGLDLFVVVDGACSLETEGRLLKPIGPGEVFGEVAVIDRRPRMAGVVTTEPTQLLRLSAAAFEQREQIAPAAYLKLTRALARQVSTYVRQPDALYQKLDVLLVQDGGCAPGYDSVTAFLTRYIEAVGRSVFVAREGFKSLVSGTARDFALLVDGRKLYEKLENFPGVIFAPPLAEARGASFRTERYKEFVRPELQRQAADNLRARGVKVLIGIGGNGTFGGIDALSKLLPEVQTFFVPVTIDSDVAGTECIGENTGVQVGAEKIACYMADARTHHRVYIIEMMGAQGGYHALHSCVGAGADLAVLPSSRFDPARIAAELRRRRSAVIVVAEGYKREERRATGHTGNAATFLHEELQAAGLEGAPKVVCEPFSRDIRGAAPNYRDVALSHRFARRLAALMLEGKTRVMPAILRSSEASISFDEIRTDNAVDSEFAALGNLLGI
jgi:6-phosphofructokinase 1